MGVCGCVCVSVADEGRHWRVGSRHWEAQSGWWGRELFDAALRLSGFLGASRVGTSAAALGGNALLGCYAAVDFPPPRYLFSWLCLLPHMQPSGLCLRSISDFFTLWFVFYWIFFYCFLCVRVFKSAVCVLPPSLWFCLFLAHLKRFSSRLICFYLFNRKSFP